MTREEKAREMQLAAKRAEVAAWAEQVLSIASGDAVTLQLRLNARTGIMLGVGQMRKSSDPDDYSYRYESKLEVAIPADSDSVEKLLGLIETGLL